MTESTPPPEYRLSNLMPQSSPQPAAPPVNRDREMIKQAAIGLGVFLVGIVGAGVYVFLAYQGYLPKLW